MWTQRFSQTVVAAFFVLSYGVLFAETAAAQTPVLALDGGTLQEECFMGVCHTNRWFCPTSSNPEWVITVTNAAANSTVTLRRWYYSGGGYTLGYQADVGTTDGSGYFQYATTPAPPSYLSAYITDVVVNGTSSNFEHYHLGQGFC